eukprot:224971-Amphidinium_carterae.1
MVIGRDVAMATPSSGSDETGDIQVVRETQEHALVAKSWTKLNSPIPGQQKPLHALSKLKEVFAIRCWDLSLPLGVLLPYDFNCHPMWLVLEHLIVMFTSSGAAWKGRNG